MKKNDFSLYIHIPFCISKCKYCDFFSLEKSQINDSYIDALCNEIQFYLTKYDIKKWQTVYIGGGTPSLLNKNQINKILKAVLCKSNEIPEEITIEVNPDDITENFLREIENTSITRLSCGIQSLNSDCLSFVKRRADSNVNKKAVDLINQYWHKGKSFDLICGLPKETEESFINALNYLISKKPDHISMYSLTVEEETPLGKMIYNEEIDYDFDFSDELWIKSKDILVKNGYEQYEISNFAKAGKESKHNLVYWNHGNYVGCGCGATGTVYNSDGSGFRWTNGKNIEKYEKFWNSESVDKDKIPCTIEEIDINTSMFEYFMMGLRKAEGISEQQFIKCFGKTLPQSFISLFIKWKNNNLAEEVIKKSDHFYFLNEEGRKYLNKFLEELDI